MSSDEQSPYAAPPTRGLKRGQRLINNKTNEDWYLACEGLIRARETKSKLSYGQFLDSEASGPSFENTKTQRQSLGNYLKRYREGTLKQVQVKRTKTRKFGSVEEKLVQYLTLRAERYQQDKCGVSWVSVRVR